MKMGGRQAPDAAGRRRQELSLESSQRVDRAPAGLPGDAEGFALYGADPVAVVLDLDMEKKHEKAKAKAVVNKWLETGVLREDVWKSGRDGREVPIIIVGEWISRSEAGL